MRDKDTIILEKSYYELILEKDHRQKIQKIGIPEDVSNYLHELDDKYSLWFADKLKKMPAFMASQNKINWIRVNILTDMQGILDWLRNVQNINIKEYTWEAAVEAQRKYHENLQSQNTQDIEKNKIIKKYNDGFYWADLETTSCREEASAMGHCGTSNNGANTLYSLRKIHPNGVRESFITIALNDEEGIYYQCKGKKNSKPKKEYYPYIVDIFINKNITNYKGEYSTHTDFRFSDLREYVEENSEDFPDIEPYLEKIEENSISFAHFEKIKNETELSYFDIYIDQSDGDDVYANYSFYVQFTPEDFPNIPNIKEILMSLDLNSYKSEDKKLFKEFLNEYDMYDIDQISIDEGYNDTNVINFYATFNLDENYFSMDDYGLKAFERICSSFERQDRLIEKSEIVEKLVKILTKLKKIESPTNSLYDFLEQEQFEFVGDYEIDDDLDLIVKSKKMSIFNNLPNADKLKNVAVRGVTESLIIYPEYKESYPYFYDFMVFVKKFFEQKIPYFSKNLSLGFDQGDFGRFYFKKLYQIDDGLDIEKEEENLKKFQEDLPQTLEFFRSLRDDVLKYYFENVKIKTYTPDDLYYDEEVYKNILSNQDNLSPLSIFRKSDNMEVRIWYRYKGDIKEYIDKIVQELNDKQYKIWPKYNEELAKKFDDKFFIDKIKMESFKRFFYRK